MDEFSSETIYQFLIEQRSETSLITDSDGRFTFICPNVHHVFGYTQAEIKMLGNIDQLLGATWRDPINQPQNDDVARFSVNFVDGRGDERHLAVSVKRVHIGAGRLLFTAYDMSEHTAIEETLRWRGEMFQRLADNAPDIVFRYQIHPVRRFDYINNAVFQILGYQPEELYADPLIFWQIIHPDERDKLMQELRSPSFCLPSMRWLHKDGSTVWIDQHIVPYLNVENGVIVAAEGIARNVTPQKESEARTHRHLNEITLLNQVMSLTATAQDLPTALQQACTVLAKFFGAPQGAVAIFDDDQTMLTVIAEYQEDDQPSALGTQIPGIGNPSVDYLLTDRTPLALNDAQNHPLLSSVHDLMLRRNTKSLLLVPILVGDEVYGTLGLDFHESRTFDAAGVALAQRMANQLGQVLQRLTLYTQGVEHARLATLLSELGERLNRSFTLDEVFQAIGEGAAELSSAERCAVFVDHTESGVVSAWSQGLSPLAIDTILDDLRSPANLRFFDSTDAVFLRDVQRMPAGALLRQLGEDEGYRSAAIWPLVFENRTVAVVVCFYEGTRNWSSIEREVMESFTRLATSTLENARLFGEAQRRTAELERLSQISSSLRSELDRSQIQSVILDEMSNLLGARSVALALRDPASLALTLVEVRGLHTELQGMKILDSPGMTNSVIASGRPLVVTDLRSLAEFDRPDLVGPSMAAVCAPLIVEQSTVGALWVVRNRPFNDAEVNLILAVADIGASAIHRAQVVETLEQRVQERTQALAEANVRLTELDVLKSKFVSDVSHELRTPIQNLKMYLDLLDRGRPEKREVYLLTLQDQVDLLQRLTEDILDLSRLELAPDDQSQETVELNHLVSQVYATLEPRAEAAGLNVSLQLDPTLPVVSADPDRLVQVINNLLSNAINYTPAAGLVRVATKHLDDGVCLQVEDNGMGISTKDMPHIFDRFYRSNRVSQSNIRGTGLGLAIVYEIVQQYQGRIEVKSEEGVGSTFCVWLPMWPGR